MNPVLLSALIWLTCALAMTAYALSRHGPDRRGREAALMWAMADSAAAVALFSYILRSELPLGASILVTNLGLLAQMLLHTMALLTVAGRPAPIRFAMAVLILTALTNTIMGLQGAALGERFLVGAVAATLLTYPLFGLLRLQVPWPTPLRVAATSLILLVVLRFGRLAATSYFDLPPALLVLVDGGFGIGTGLVAVVANVSFLWLTVSIRTEAHEAERARLLAELALAKDRAEAASRAKSAFIANMGHELRTPLNAIIGFNELISTDKVNPLTPVQREWAQHVDESGRHLLQLLNDVLDLAQIEAGRMQIVPSTVRLESLGKEVLSALRHRAARAGITLSAEMGGLTMVTDRLRLRQVLTNLVSNAVKYNHPQGMVRLTAESIPGDRIRIEVTDNGPGIPEAKRPLLFQPFNRLGAEASGVEGTGIGLSIARQLTETMGGRIGFTPAVDGGSRFWIELPDRLEADQRGTVRADRQTPATPVGTILLGSRTTSPPHPPH